jgi:hypothetical protein
MFSCSNNISVVVWVYIFNVTYKIDIEQRKPLLLLHVIAKKRSLVRGDFNKVPFNKFVHGSL